MGQVRFSLIRPKLLATSEKRREVFGESLRGRLSSYEEPIVEADFSALSVLSCMWVTASIGFVVFWSWPVPETAMGMLDHIHTTLYDHLPCAE